ncbi:aldehyde dehydrogenase [Bacillus coahuilensis m2-6]|uniref:aldehyde dehydrogenase family protein n=1 Tax=Bacillus coahuilensis TaxID=408580 RepID=UPI0007504EE0|nr:aldehyde dehydrogenase family protein [Bacillus coahuilensis]KUP05627.1 aldehyde dehydrogenase [Bacillus coahuilensis m2-6]
MNTNFEKVYINGEWQKGTGEGTIDVQNPFTQESILSISAASKKDVKNAYEVAKLAQKDWKNTLPQKKQEILYKAIDIVDSERDVIVEWMIKETGSTFMKSMGEVDVSLNIMREAATYPFRMEGKVLPSITEGKENRVYRDPLGVVGVISPWNFPFHLAVRSIITALATGNAVVVKPSTKSPVTGGLIFASIFEEAGLPKGLLNVVVGKSSEIGDEVIVNPIPRLISFTGSTDVGQHIGELAGKHLKKTALELGGNNVFIVLEDADIEQAVESALFGKFYHQGQICMSINRFMIDEKIAKDFTEAFLKRVKELEFGDPSAKTTHIGPLISRDQVDRILDLVKESTKEGATLLHGGQAEGNVLEPTILTDVKQSMSIVQNEIFGPVAAIMTFQSEDEVLSLANELPYGLSGAIHSRDLDRAMRIAREVETGMIHINDQPVNDEPHMPFGGEKKSGLGRFNGEWALEEFTTVKWVSIQRDKRDYSPFIQ